MLCRILLVNKKNEIIKMSMKFVIIGLILLFTIIPPVMGNGIIKNTNLGPFYGNHRYYIHLYNVDDIERITINGEILATVSVNHENMVDITNYLKDGTNSISLTDENTAYIWTYGFDIIQDSNTIYSDSCGTVAGVIGIGARPGNGCNSDDETLGIVYQNFIMLTLGQAPIPTPYPPRTSGFEILITIAIVAIVYANKRRRK